MIKVYNLFLFDGNGTLHSVPKAHVIAYESMMRDIFGIERPSLDGFKSHDQIYSLIRESLKAHGIDETTIDQNIEIAIEHMALVMEDFFADNGNTNLLPGVKDFLDAIPEFHVIGHYTGNAIPIAQKLLIAHGIRTYFNILSCAKSADDTREIIITRAIVEAIRDYGKPKRVYVIGDTPADIKAGKALDSTDLKVKTVAVATGAPQNPIWRLQRHNPDYAFPSLKNHEQVLEEILK